MRTPSWNKPRRSLLAHHVFGSFSCCPRAPRRPSKRARAISPAPCARNRAASLPTSLSPSRPGDARSSAGASWSAVIAPTRSRASCWEHRRFALTALNRRTSSSCFRARGPSTRTWGGGSTTKSPCSARRWTGARRRCASRSAWICARFCSRLPAQPPIPACGCARPGSPSPRSS